MKRRSTKRKTIAQEVDKAAVLLQKLVGMKAADDYGYCQCVTCGKVDHYKSYARRSLHTQKSNYF